jgi:hypothetical protein
MYSITYVSSATHLFTGAQLRDLLEQARDRNSREGLTGLLLYKGGNFMQVLEGGRQAVENARMRIEADPRHRGMLILLQGEIPCRAFPEWSMAFRDLDSRDVRELPGFSEFLNVSFADTQFTSDAGASSRLLRIFRERM